MSSVKYSKEFDPATTAKAMAYEINVSPKHCVEIFNYIRHMKVSVAKTILENVIDKKQSIPFKRYARNVGHKRHQTARWRRPLPGQGMRRNIKTDKTRRGKRGVQGPRLGEHGDHPRRFEERKGNTGYHATCNGPCNRMEH